MAGIEVPGSPHVGRVFPRRHPWRFAALVLAVVGVLVLSSGALRYAFRSHPGPKSVDSALEQFRSTTSTSTGTTDFMRPEAGVYAARGQGSEHISFPPNSQADGAVMPVTVQDLPGGCWRFRIDYNTAHWHAFDFCPEGRKLLLTGDRNYQSWDFGAMHVTNLAEFVCDPPSPIVVEPPRAGDSFPNDCTGSNTAVSGTTTAAGRATVVGVDELDIGGRRVAAIHQHRTQTMTGSQRGGADEDWWFARDTGLPLQVSRDYTLRSGSPLGDITYTERGSWRLTSTVPRT